MAKMKIDYGKFEDWATKINSENEALIEYLRQINSHIQSLQGDWESNAAVEIRTNIENMGPKFEQFYQVVDNYVKTIRNVASTYKEAEGQLESNAQEFKR